MDQYLDPVLFLDQKSVEMFICCVCSGVAIDPLECITCNSLFCNTCYLDCKRKKPNICPRARCNLSLTPVCKIHGMLKRIYNCLEIRCNLPNCNRTMHLSRYFPHITKCQAKKCKNYSNCDRILQQDQDFCSFKCQFYYTLTQQPSIESVYNMVDKQFQQYFDQPVKQIKINTQHIKYQQMARFKWNKQTCYSDILVKDDDMTLQLDEKCFIFRTVLADQPLQQGIHYWEITTSTQNEFPIKIGVSTSDMIEMNTAFCDYETGFGYYGIGQLRNGSKSRGKIVRQSVINGGVVGVYLNMNRGLLMFSLDGQLIDNKFVNQSLKQPNIYPAVSLIHNSQCTLSFKDSIPTHFR